MLRHKKRIAAVSFGIPFLALAGFLLANQGYIGLAQEKKPSETTKCSSCGGKGGQCCSSSGKKCCCANKQLDFISLGDASSAPLLLAQKQGQKPKMPKISKEAMAKGMAARKAIEDHRKALTKEGTYSCCISPGCTFCSTSADMCPCAKMLRKGGPVCPECWGGWQVGFGRLPKVDPAKVKVIPRSKLKMMYKMKAMMREKSLEKSNK